MLKRKHDWKNYYFFFPVKHELTLSLVLAVYHGYKQKPLNFTLSNH